MLIFAKMSDFTSLNHLHALSLFHSTFDAHQILLLIYNMESTTDKECELHYFRLYYHVSKASHLM